VSAGALLYRAALAVSAVAAVAGFVAWPRPPSRGTRLAWGLGAAAVAVATGAAWSARWVEAGHLPVFGTYENAASMAFAVAVAALLWEWRAGFSSGVAAFAALAAAGLLAQGLRHDPAIYALTVSERSLVVDAHALLAWGAFGVLTVNAALALGLLARPHAAGPAAGRALIRTLELGFLLHSGMMASGSLYELMLSGKVWSFDPIETLGLVAWLSYAALLHLKLLAGWDARRLAGWCLFVFVLLVVSYRAIVYFPSWATYHVFDVGLRPYQ
jgi:ABC-type transport system involved in cytochrome c biogenesis permease subunit